jgi:glycogen operon protein
MLLGGDEFRRSQSGNNNAYCQDNEVGWIDWSLPAQNSEVFQFARGMLAFRRAHPVLRQETFYAAEDVLWFNPSGKSPDWFNPRQRCVACRIRGQDASDLFLIFNAGTEAVEFVLPPSPSPRTWRIAADTAQPVQQDFYRPGDETALLNPASYTVQSRSSVILVSR